MFNNSTVVLQSILETIPDLVFYKDYFNADGEYIGCNQAFELFVGKDSKEIVGYTDIDIFGEQVGNFFRKKDKEVLNKGETLVNEEWVMHSDGRPLLLSTAKTPLYNEDGSLLGVLGISRDITDLSGKTLLELHNEQVVKQTHDSVISTDMEGNIKRWNEVSEKLLGYTAEEAIGQHISMIYLEEDFVGLEQSLKELKETEESQRDVRLVKKSGDILHADLHLSLLKDSMGVPVEFVGYSQDITKRVEAENELRRLNAFLQEQVDEEVEKASRKQAKLAQLGSVMSMIAHQWRQPLNALGLIVQQLKLYHHRKLLTTEKLDENIDKSMELIHGMSKTIDDFMQLVKDDAEKKMFNVLLLTQKVQSIMKSQLQSQSVKLIYEIDPLMEINSYYNEIFHIILNLVANAYDAFEGKDITYKYILIKAVTNGDNFELIVKDNAGGIPEGLQEKIFNPFFTTKKEGKGTGLGLDMNRRMVEELLHGKINVHNDSDGAVFTIKMKL